MVLTPSAMLPLGTPMSDFSLPNPADNTFTTAEKIRGKKGTLVMFICNHCPFVVHVKEELKRLYADYQNRKIGFVAINSNDADAYPDDAPERMPGENYPFPYLFDTDQSVAKSFSAACTPDFFLFDDQNKLVYRGQLDGSRPGNSALPNGKDLRNALDTLLSGNPISETQHPSMGCNIKWK